MSNPTVAAGASFSLLPAHRRQAGTRLPATSSSLFVSKSRSLHRREELFSRGRHRHPPPLYSMCNRTQTMIPSCLAKRSMVGKTASMQNKEREARIKKQLLNPKLSPSPYDTAWVAMVPVQGFPQAPSFPQCVEWILLHQHDNGSWGIGEFHLSTNKCTLLSTLACVIALKKWNVGVENIKRGLDFIGRNFSIAMDEHIDAPVGFNITFSGMISLAIDMGLEVPVRKTDVDRLLHIRRRELKRFDGDKSYGTETYMAYVAEGLGNLLDWKDAMKFQRMNGSFFNSPSTTSVSLIYYYDEKALQYLKLLVNKFGGSVPAVFPTNIHCQLSMVDSLEKIGVSRHFSSEIKNILDMTYIFWLQRDEEILLDVATCAMAFRILRMNGYDVSSDELSHVAEASGFHNSLQGYINDTKSLLELYKASRVSVSKNEPVLDNIGYWSSNLLMAKLCNDRVHRVPILGEVDYALKFPFYATLDRIEHRRNIEHFDDNGYQLLKTSNLSCPLNKEHLDLAIEDFTYSQFIYQDELMHLESWVKENRLDQLEFARQKQAYACLSACATIFPPELSKARISWAKNCVLTTIIDDFFDVAGSKEELDNIVALVEKWDEHHKLQFYSERVKIIYCAIYTTTIQITELALVVQNRDVRSHLKEIWIDTVRCMSTEAEWARSHYVPTFDEYITYANTSFALGPVLLPALYFVGQEVSESVVKDQEYNELLRLVNTCGRLLNDIQGFEREGSQGKLNSVPLLVLHSGGSMSSETAKRGDTRVYSFASERLAKIGS